MKIVLLALILIFTACTSDEPDKPIDPPVVVDPPTDPVDPVDPPTDPVDPPVVSKTEVYEGCPALTEPNGTVITIGEGKDYATITALDKTKTLKGGETIEFYGTIERLIFNKWKTPNLKDNAKYIYLDFSKGDIKSVEMSEVSYLAIMNASMQKETKGNTIITRDANNIVIQNMTITGRDNIEGLTAQTWQDLAGGISLLRTKCASVTNNSLNILRSGIGVSMDTVLTYPENSSKTLIKDNKIRNISGDVHRMNASDLIIEGTDFKDGWVSGSDGDLNHDDMVQGFAIKGEVYENVTIRNNTFIESTDYRRPLIGTYQGIAIFDGLYKNVTVTGNTIIGSAYHGISLYGTDTALIENNIVISPIKRKFWISTFDSKVRPDRPLWTPKNIKVRNNISSHLAKREWAENVNNKVVTEPEKDFVKFDLDNGEFDFTLKTQ